MQELLVSHKRKRFQMRKETKERKNNQLSCRQRERKVRGMALFSHGYLQPAGPACCVWWARVQGKQQEPGAVGSRKTRTASSLMGLFLALKAPGFLKIIRNCVGVLQKQEEFKVGQFGFTHWNTLNDSCKANRPCEHPAWRDSKWLQPKPAAAMALGRLAVLSCGSALSKSSCPGTFR